MKFTIINPNSDENTVQLISEKIQAYYSASHEIEVVCMKSGPLLVKNHYDYHLAADEMIEFVKKSDADAFIIGCHADPNLDLMRTVTDKPVLGMAEVSLKIAGFYSERVAVISPSDNSVKNKKKMVKNYNMEGSYLGGLVTKSDRYEDLLEAARIARDKLGADTIVLGCANYILHDRAIERELKVKVIDGISFGIGILETMCRDLDYKSRR